MYLNICLLGKQDKNQNQKCKQPTQLFVYQTCANESNNGRFKDGGGTITLMIVTKTQKSSAIWFWHADLVNHEIVDLDSLDTIAPNVMFGVVLVFGK